MRSTIFLLAMLGATTAHAQTYTECENRQGRLYCQHGAQGGIPQLRANAVDPRAVLPPANPMGVGNPFITDTHQQQQEDELRRQQIEYYRNLNKQFR